MRVGRLGEQHAEALEELLVGSPTINIFLLGYLDAMPVEQGQWWGAAEGDRLAGAAILVPGRLMVPFAPTAAAAQALGRAWHGHIRPCMAVGPRKDVDTIWHHWAGDRHGVDRWYDQRLYVCREPVPGKRPDGFRRAHHDELEALIANAAEMELEDLGRDPRHVDEEMFRAAVERRVRQGSTWVVVRCGKIAFQINVGTRTAWGCQVGGTYVPPEFRGAGLATEGMRALTRALLPRYRCITLHVNEANLPAVRTYERSGFVADKAFRLTTLKDA